MSTTKPTKAAGKRPVRAVAPAPIALTPDEAKFLRCYREMDQRRKGEALSLAECQAERHPAIKRPAPPAGIRLVTAAGKRVAS